MSRIKLKHKRGKRLTTKLLEEGHKFLNNEAQSLATNNVVIFQIHTVMDKGRYRRNFRGPYLTQEEYFSHMSK